MTAEPEADEQRLAARRDALTAAGLELFGARGYAGTSTEEVCAEAGLRPAEFGEHFASKEELFRAVFERVVEETTGNVVEALELEPKGLERRARAGLSAVARTLLEDRRKGRVQLLEAGGISPAMESRRREVRRAFAAVIARDAERAATAGEIPRRDFEPLALALVGAVQEILADGVAAEDPAPVDALIDDLVRLFLAAATAV